MKKKVCIVVGFIGFFLMIGGPSICDMGGSLARSIITMLVGLAMVGGAIEVANKIEEDE